MAAAGASAGALVVLWLLNSRSHGLLRALQLSSSFLQAQTCFLKTSLLHADFSLNCMPVSDCRRPAGAVAAHSETP